MRGGGKAPDNISDDYYEDGKPSKEKGKDKFNANSRQGNCGDDFGGPTPPEGDASAEEGHAGSSNGPQEFQGDEVDDAGKGGSQEDVFDESKDCSFFHRECLLFK